MLAWSGTSEIDLYPYIRELLTNLFGYPRDHIRLAERGSQGKIPDVSLVSADVKPKDSVYWVVGEAKRERRAFRSSEYRRKEWQDQLKQYVSADTVYALLIDPETLTILRPDGTEIKTVELDAHSADELLSSTTDCSLAMLHYSNSVCETSLLVFKEGLSPSRYLDVTKDEDRKKFYAALRVSARELIDYSLGRLGQLQEQYLQYQNEMAALKEKVGDAKEESVELAKKALRQQYKEATRLFEDILKVFERQIGKQMPNKEEEAGPFLQNLYATEGSSLVLARILFVRFLEDHDMALRKISNGGIKAFRDYHRHIKDDYQFLLTDAYKEAEQLYRRLFEPSVFDWSHEGDGQLSRLLLRIFYRLNAFDFAKISGDILGNLYERFLDIGKRKKLGEYYTPMYVARYVLDRIGFYENPAPLLDPACGSGTFLIAAADGLIERLVAKGVKLDVAINQAVELIHGLDINVFAAFIAQLQLIWHLLPYLKRVNAKEMPELKVYGGTNSLVYMNQKTLFASALDLPTETSAKVRDSKFRYVVGNPPYIRNERLKDTGSWRENYEAVDFRNSDIAYFFVARAIEGKRDDGGVAMPSWLEDKGRMCFVLPMGLCDSETAKRIREKLMRYRLLELTDLESVAIHIFPSPQASGRATVAPVLLFVERTAPGQNEVELVQVAEQAAIVEDFRPEYLERTRLPQSVFVESGINPHGQFFAKLKAEDIPLLQILMSKQSLQDFVVESTPTYGIKVGAAGRLRSQPLPGLLPIGKGQNISSYYLNTATRSWVDIGNVTDKSIWGKPDVMNAHLAYALSEITMAPQCAVFDPTTYALSNVAVVFVPKIEFRDFPWDVLLNSSIMRFAHLLALRVGLVGVGTPIEGGRRVSWCHMYPRTVASFPVTKDLMQYSEELASLGRRLRALGTKIGRRWETVTEEIARSPKKPLALHEVDFSNWQVDIEEQMDLRLARERDVWTLRLYSEDQQTLLHLEGSYELLNVVRYLLESRDEEGLSARAFQNLAVPTEPESISRLIDIARDPNSSDITEFKRLFKQADDIVAAAYGLDQAQWKYVQSRLATPPFDVLQSRWPWKAVEMREIQEYAVDRFA
jgi:type I restriction-modification system DNA methylase subunit